MAQLSPTTAFEHYVRSLYYLALSLELDATTVHLAPAVREREQICRAFLQREGQVDLDVLGKRVTLTFVDRALGREIRTVAATAKTLDAADPTVHVFNVLFEHKTPSSMTKPVGLGVERELGDARGLVAAVGLLPPTVTLDPLRERSAKLAQVCTTAETALGEAKTALRARKDLSLVRRQLKTEARTLFATIKGQLDALYPNERELVESFFLPRDETRSTTEREDDDVQDTQDIG